MIKRFILIILTLSALWLSLAVTTGLVYSKRDPAMSLAGWHSASADAEEAALLLQRDQQASNLERATKLAHRALLRDPLNAVAARTLGLVASLRGQIVTARRWFDAAQWMSRRDLPTQLWLIEDAVGQGQIDRSLQHYNYALNTSRSAEAMLFPILVGASGEPAIYRPLADLLRKRPLWWERFVDRLVSTSNSPVGLMNLVGAVRLDVRKAGEQQLAARAIQRLLQLDAVPYAFALYQRVSGNPQQGIRNSNFAASNPLPPFDWDFADQADVYASIVAGPDTEHSQMLYMTAANGKGGIAAQQMLNIKPGRYELSASARSATSDVSRRARLQINCHNDGNDRVVDLVFPSSDNALKPMTAPVNIPENKCSFQQLHIVVPGSIDGGTTESWITGISIRPQ